MSGKGEQKGLPGLGRYREPPRRGVPRIDFTDLPSNEAAAAFGMTVQNLQNWKRAGCGGWSQDDDGHLHWNLPAVIAWRRERDVENAGGTPGETLLEGGASDSPALEQLRRKRHDLLDVEYRQRIGELIERDQVIEQFREASRVLRTALEGVQRRFGDEVGDAIRDALDQARGELGLD
ncbi:MAG: hypothetical protein R6V05_03805 [Candidatus Brocadiia bacterium]